MMEIVKPRGCALQCAALDVRLEMFRYAWNLPPIVFAIEFVGKEIKLGLQRGKIFNWPRLPGLQLHFLYFSIQTDRLDRPSAFLQAMSSAIRIVLISEKEIMVKLRGVAERFVQLLVLFRTFWAWRKERTDAFKHSCISSYNGDSQVALASLA